MPKTNQTYFKGISNIGITYTVAGIFFLVTGILRGELIATICGSVLVFFIFFSFCLALCTFLLWKNKGLTVQWKDNRTLLIVLNKEINQKLPWYVFLAETSYQVIFTASSEKNSSRFFVLTIPLTKERVLFPITLPPRGLYTTAAPRLKITDFAHFFTFPVLLDVSNAPCPLTILPLPERPLQKKFTSSNSGLIRGKSTYKRSDDLFETRIYTPGDDPRKINWKVYAHSGNLSIRDGELIPPPSSEHYFIINTYQEHESIPYNEKWFDMLMNRAVFIALELLKKHKAICLCSINSEGNYNQVPINANESNATFKALSFFSTYQLSSAQSNFSDIIPFLPHNATVLFFTLPQKAENFSESISLLKKHQVYLGPFILPITETSRWKKIINSMFLEQIPKDSIQIKEFRKSLTFNFQKLLKEGFNVSKI